MDEPVRLAVDLGTTHTVAVVRRGGQQPRALLFDGTPLLSSGVFVDAAGVHHTGRDGQRLGAAQPERFEPHPKRRVDEGTVLLGELEVRVEELLAASLRRVGDEARTAGIDPVGATVLTCPADWGQPRRNVLRAAAWRAGLGEVRLLDEPIAAATYCVQVLGQQVAPGQCLGVFDFGGGTFDVAVVRREPAGLRVLATGGLDDLGGLDVDSALVAHLGQLVAVGDPALWHRLGAPGDQGERRDRQAFWSEVRAAKEMLSRSSVAPVHVPGRPEPMHLTREELERVAGPLVARAVDETRRVLERSGVQPGELGGLLLVGGASRMPLVASRLHARLGVAPSVPEQPELPVAFGALVHVMASSPATGEAGLAPYPVSGPIGVGSPSSPYPVSTPFQPGPRSGPVFAGGVGPAGPVSPPMPPAVPPAMGPGGQPVAPIAKPPARPKRPVRRALLVAMVFTLVGGLMAGVVTGARWLIRTLDDSNLSIGGPGGGGLTGGDENGGDGELAAVHTVALKRDGTAGVAVVGDNVVYAVAGGGSTEVVSLPGGGGAARWTVSVPIEPSEIRLTAVGDLVVLDGESSSRDDGDDVRAVLSAADGKLLWKKKWVDRRDISYVGTDAVVEYLGGSLKGNAVLRVDLRNGREKWRRTGGNDLLVIDHHRIEAVRQWPDGKGDGALPGAQGALFDVFTATPEAVVELDAGDAKGWLVDTSNGKTKGSGRLPIGDEHWTVYGGLVIGLQNDDTSGGKAVLAGYKLPSFAKAWTYPLTNGFDVEKVKPCGQHLVCMAVDEPENDKTIAVDVRTGKQAWKVDVEWSEDEGWYATGDRLVFGDATFDTVTDAKILKGDGTAAGQYPDFSHVLATRGGRMAVQEGRVEGSEVILQVYATEIATGKSTKAVDIGKEAADQVSIGGDLVAVWTGDRRILVLKIKSFG
ncbi:Hsp70 family protein [Micromonospora sp. CPCC 205371]|nr:Hsp70 family protein [Micromonospora sp. CPCC 205371]